MTALLGIVVGALAALPIALLLGQDEPSLGKGIGAVAFSFLLIQGSLLALHAVRPADVAPFGSMSVLTFLGGAIAAVVRRELRR